MRLGKLKRNPTAGVIAPAYIPVKERLEQGILYLENRGMHVKRGSTLSLTHGYFAGNDSQRLNDLHQMFLDPEVDLIICARGGWGGLRIADKIDYDLIANHPKPFIGYSDITTLQLAIWKMTGMPSLSGPMVAVEMGRGIEDFTEEHFWGQIYNRSENYTISLSESGGQIFRAGKAKGILLGGCLSMVTGLLGTPYLPDFTDTILFLEDVGEKPYRIDRYLAQLTQAGIFDKINGLILGKFEDCVEDPGEVSFSLPEIITDYFSHVNLPVIVDFPYGHGARKITMPIGGVCEIDTHSGIIAFANIFNT